MPEIRVTVGTTDAAIQALLARIAVLPDAEEYLATEQQKKETAGNSGRGTGTQPTRGRYRSRKNREKAKIKIPLQIQKIKTGRGKL